MLRSMLLFLNDKNVLILTLFIVVLCGCGNKALLKEERFSVFVSNPERRRTD